MWLLILYIYIYILFKEKSKEVLNYISLFFLVEKELIEFSISQCS